MISFPPQRVTPRTLGPKGSVTVKEPAPWFTLSDGCSLSLKGSRLHTFLCPRETTSLPPFFLVFSPLNAFMLHKLKRMLTDHMFTFDCILLLKPLKLNHAHMFTSEAELQWCLKVGREALEMIMCFPFFLNIFYYPIWWDEEGCGGEWQGLAGRTSDDWKWLRLGVLHELSSALNWQKPPICWKRHYWTQVVSRWYEIYTRVMNLKAAAVG